MSHNFVSGDVVRIGNGKVEYTVEEVYPGDVVKVRGGKNNRAQDVEASRLTMVKANVALEELSLSTHNTIAETLEDGVFVLIDGEEPVRFKSFDSAAFHVSRNHTYRFATIVKDRAVTVQRKRVVA